MNLKHETLSDDYVAVSWLIRLRWAGVTAQLTLVIGLVYWLAPQLNAFPLFLAVGVGFLSNVVAYYAALRPNARPSRWLHSLLWLDIVTLTVLLYFSGGSSNPFSTLYLTQVMIAAVLLRARWAVVLGTLACVCYGLLFYYYVPIGMDHHMHDPTTSGYDLHLRGMWLSFVVVASSTVFFVTRVRNDLRAKELELEKLRHLQSHQEKLAALATLSAGAAHELSTPLTTIGLVISEVAHQIDKRDFDQETREDLHLARSEINRCKLILQNMSGQFSEFASDSPVATTPKNFLLQLQDSLPQSDVILVPSEITVNYPILLDETGLLRCVETLVDNALAASGRDGPISVEFGPTPDILKVVVWNNGEIIPEDLLVRLGEPFFTTKEPGEGMGLGLFLVRLFCQRHGGTFSLNSTPALGTQATIILPLRRSDFAHAA